MRRVSNQAIKRMISLHGWSGSLVAVFLYAVVFTGTLSVLKDEINRWADPSRAVVHPFERPIEDTYQRLKAQVPQAFQGQVLIEGAQDGSLRMFFYERRKVPGAGRVEYGRDYLLDPETHRILAARQGVAPHRRLTAPYHALTEFFVDLHARLLIPGRAGLYATGLLGIVLLVAALTGVLIHRHMFRDLFVSERPGGRIVSLRDRHVLASVWGLPFAVLLAFTGTFLSFAVSLGLPVVAISAFGGDTAQAFAAVTTPAKVINATPADLANLDVILTQAQNLVGTHPQSIAIEDAGRSDARVETFHRHGLNGAVRPYALEFDGATGAFRRDRPLVGQEASIGAGIVALMSPLHIGDFSGLASRAVWLALGALMTVSVVSGVQLWLKRRRGDAVWDICDKVFATVVWGLPVALVGAGLGYFFTVISGATHVGTVTGFLLAGFVAMVIALVATCVDTLRLRMRRLLAWGLVVLPVMRLQTGGVSWGEAIWHNIWQVLLIDVLCIGVALLLFYKHQADRRKPAAPLGALE